ncbi:MAG: hypothetical protein NTU94_14390 [Planctomycetota bacterium]|nr:hypothetical protein [Planctomycetota bacterium]
MSEQPESAPRKPAARLMIVALVALGLVVRVALALMIGEGQAAQPPGSDEFLAIGKSVTEGKGFVLAQDPLGLPRVAWRMPGYPVLVSAAARLTATSLRGLTVFQSICGAAALIVVGWAAVRLAGLWAGLAAVALVAFDPYQVYFAALAVPVVPTGLALAAAMALGLEFLVSAASSRWAWFWAAATGVALAAAAYLQPWAAGLAIPAGVAAIVARRCRRILAGWAVGTAVLVVCLAPWAARNALRLGVPVLTTDTGAKLYGGTEGLRGTGGEAGKQEPVGEAKGLDEIRQDVSYLRSAAGLMAEHPAAWLKEAALRAGRLWSPGPMLAEDEGPVHPAAGYTSLLPTAVLALLGVWALRRERAVLVWLLLAPLWLTLVQAVLGSAPPDRLVVMPPLAVLGGVGLLAILGRGKTANTGAPI